MSGPNPLIANCPEDPALAAAYWRGARDTFCIVLPGNKLDSRIETIADLIDELECHVLRMMQGRETPP